jgi:hypothetical protein
MIEPDQNLIVYGHINIESIIIVYNYLPIKYER